MEARTSDKQNKNEKEIGPAATIAALLKKEKKKNDDDNKRKTRVMPTAFSHNSRGNPAV